MDRKLRKFHKRKQNPPKVVEKKQRLRMMHAELSIEEQIQLAANNKLYSNRNPEKGIRIFTVVLYFLSISLAAIILSVYYVYFWHPEYKNTTMVRNPNCELIKEVSLRTVNATELFYNKLLHKLRIPEDRKSEKLKKSNFRYHPYKEIAENSSYENISNEFGDSINDDYVMDEKLLTKSTLFNTEKTESPLVDDDDDQKVLELEDKLNEMIEIRSNQNKNSNGIDMSDEFF